MTTRRGVLIGASPLEPVSTATTIRIDKGHPVVSDGPFAETKEQLAGYYLLECADIDEAIEWAARAWSPRPVSWPMDDLRHAIESVFRRESGRIIAGLIRVSGSFDLAEEAMQDAYVRAMSDWTRSGVPENPGGWLATVAHRRLIDYGRRERTRRDKEPELTYHIESQSPGEPELGDPMVPDDQLRLIFTCCHPALSIEAQVALMLRTLGGLTTVEIVRALLLSEPTLAQRLVRARGAGAHALESDRDR